MADRIIAMRTKLYDTLVKLDTPGEWGHIKSQIGMFSFTGLKPEQVDALAQKASIYLTRDGRISMAALNDGNVEVSRVTNDRCCSEAGSQSRKAQRGSSRKLTE
jgi:aspartate aminotransferase